MMNMSPCKYHSVFRRGVYFVHSINIKCLYPRFTAFGRYALEWVPQTIMKKFNEPIVPIVVRLIACDTSILAL